jgi:hypothetical protein
MEIIEFEHAFLGYKFISFGNKDYFVVTEDEFKNIKKILGKKFNKNLSSEEFKQAYMVELI